MSITLAVVGCGRIAENAHIPALKQLSARVKYCVDIIPERAQRAAEKLNAVKAITDYKTALADKEVDAVYVLTPNFAHYTITMDALQSGKHVFCEKPITVSYGYAQEMAETARKTGRVLNIGVCNRFHKTVNIVKHLYDTGKLGNLYHIYCSFRNFRSIPGLGGDFTTKSISGGGVLIDWGVHFFDLILYILGDAKLCTVTADTYNVLGKNIAEYVYKGMWAGPPKPDGINDTEECVSGYIRTDKVGISFNGAWAQNIDEKEMFIDFLGDKAGIRLYYGSHFVLYGAEDGVLKKVVADYEIPNMYLEESADFLSSVQSGEKSRNHIDNVLASAKLLDVLYASAEQKREIAL